jgi:hypothetical protein
MSFDFSITEKEAYLIYKLKGIRSRKANSEVAESIRRVSTETSCHRVLVDAVALENRLGVLNAHAGPTTDFPWDVASKRIKVAVLDRREFEKNYRFFETVARNAGYFLWVFVDRKKALGWLLSDEMY